MGECDAPHTNGWCVGEEAAGVRGGGGGIRTQWTKLVLHVSVDEIDAAVAEAAAATRRLYTGVHVSFV